MVVTNNVMDRIALKFTFCKEMKLDHCTDFIFSLSDITGQFKRLHEKKNWQKGYGFVLIDASVSSSVLEI